MKLRLPAGWGVPEDSQAPALEGALGEISLATVLSIFDLERRSGILTLYRGPRLDTLGQVLVREGRVVGAWVWTRRPLSGREAFRELLDWREGRFGFRPGVVEAEDQLGGSTAHLLLEAARCFDEGGRAAR